MSKDVTERKSNNGSKYDNDKKKGRVKPKTSSISMIALLIILIITVVTIPRPFQPVGKPTLLHVWYYGWITAISTGLGVIPLIFIPKLDSYWVGVSNGKYMMFSESFCTS